jgi:hypothetical protein
MPLSLSQIEVGAIVDWNIEWKGNKESHRNPIRRGMVVRVEGDPSMESVQEVWVTFGPDLGKDKFEFNGVTIPMVKVAPRELNLVFGKISRVAQAAWQRTFKVPDQVGTIYESRQQRSGKPKTVDALQLTGAPSQGPISDGPSAKKEDED